MSSSEIAIKHV